MQDGGCDGGVGVDGVVDGVEGREVVEGRRGEEVLLGWGEGVEVLPAALGYVVVGCFAVLAVGDG